MNLKDLLDTACKAAKAAGEIIRTHDRSQLNVVRKDEKSKAAQVVTELDILCQNAILKHLENGTKDYDLGLLTEELKDDGSRHKKDYFWCIDPLDGTLAYINGQAGYSCSIALISKKGEAVLGVVYNPVEDKLYYAAKGMGAYCNERPLLASKSSSDCLTVYTDSSFKKNEQAKPTEESIARLCQKSKLRYQVKDLSYGAVMNAMKVLDNPPSIYLKLPKTEQGGGCIWDFAASTAIFHELGANASDFEGNALLLNPKDTLYMNRRGVFYSSSYQLKPPLF